MASASTLAAPSGDPTERRKFQLTNLDGNNNKFYLVETWPLPAGDVFFRVSYGRVGAAPQVREKIAKPHEIERVIREKVAKGYQEVTLHRPIDYVPPATPDAAIHPKVQQVTDYIFAEAGDQIASWLAIAVDGLSQDQIARGRALLGDAQTGWTTWQQSQSRAAFGDLATTVQQFYNTIPTQLPSRIDREQVVREFCGRFDEQEDRLNQLEAAIATYTAQNQNPALSRYDTLGAELALLPEHDQRHADVRDYIDRTCVHSYKVRVRDIFAVTIPDERRAFEQNSRGRKRVELLFHGTASQNARHILRSGLICPRTASHGRMFGHGIYFANHCTKSANYCSASRRQRPHMLFLADVAIGRAFVARDAMPNRRAAPMFHDSVLGKAGATMAWGGSLRFDEYIVYRAAQQTIRYLVTFDR